MKCIYPDGCSIFGGPCPSCEPETNEMTILNEIAARRQQQIAKGYDTAHDDEHAKGEIALGAAAYCQSAARPKVFSPKRPGVARGIPQCWPWAIQQFNPQNPREDLIDAAAMIVAEIERLDRIEGER